MYYYDTSVMLSLCSQCISKEMNLITGPVEFDIAMNDVY